MDDRVGPPRESGPGQTKEGLMVVRRNILVTALLLALIVAPAVAQTSNTGGRYGGPTPNVLTGGGGILYAPSESDDPALRAAISAEAGAPVDYWDGTAGTPTLGDLAPYNCVYTWTNFAYSDNIAMGNVLADFVDGGGVVVLGAFTTFTGGNFLGGRVMTSGYSPVTGGANHFASSNYSGDGTTSIHDGVNAYECTFRDILSLQGPGAQDGSYQDGEIAHAYSPTFSVVYSNGSGAVQLGCTGDWALLVANSCAAVIPVELEGFDVE
jgi:hypothetical protein